MDPTRRRPQPSRGSRSALWVLLLACHPEPAVAVTALVSLLAASAGKGIGTLLVAAAVGSGQLGVGWSNDYLDRGRDLAAGRVDKPIPNGRVSATAVRNAALGALAATVPLSLAAGPGFAGAHLAAVTLAMAYNAGLKSLAVSVLPYTMAFGLVPIAVTQAADGRWPAPWAVVAAGLMGAGAHFTQVLPDIERDRSLGTIGLPQLLGPRASTFAAAGLLLAANGVIAVGPGRPEILQATALIVAAVLTLAVIAVTFSGRRELAFRLTLVVAAIAVVSYLLSGRAL